MRKLRYAFFVGLIAWGEVLTPREALHRLLSSSRLEKSWFAEPFLAQVPLTRVEDLLKEFTRTHGRYLRIAGTQNPYRVEYERAFLPAYITLDNRGQITGLRFLYPRHKWISWAEAHDSLFQRPEVVSVLVRREDSVLYTPAGKRYLVAMTWNDPRGLDEEAFTQAYAGLLDLAVKTASHR